MTGVKVERKLKVYSISDRDYQKQPTIRLMGKWVGELGFQIGETILVHCEDGKLIITLAKEA